MVEFPVYFYIQPIKNLDEGRPWRKSIDSVGTGVGAGRRGSGDGLGHI